MKRLIFLFPLLFILGGCGLLEKSEEAVILKIDTKSILKNRNIETNVKINNNEVEKLTN